jgi:hypothetical protein
MKVKMNKIMTRPMNNKWMKLLIKTMKAKMNKTMTKLMNNKWTKLLIKQMKVKMNKVMTKPMNNKWTKPLIKPMKAKMNKLTTKMMKIQMRQVEIQTKVKQVILMKVNRIHQMRVNKRDNVLKITSLIRDNVSHTLV